MPQTIAPKNAVGITFRIDRAQKKKLDLLCLSHGVNLSALMRAAFQALADGKKIGMKELAEEVKRSAAEYRERVSRPRKP